MSILVFNSGSSSLKFALFDDNARETLAKGEIDWADGNRQRAKFVLQPRHGVETQARVEVPDDRVAAEYALFALLKLTQCVANKVSAIKVVGHRIVHGGIDFRESVLIDHPVKKAIAQLADLAPLHNPPALKTVQAAEASLPDLPQVAVFDTTFYSSMPPRSYIYPVPYEWYSKWGIRRFGFHGISHSYCASRAAELLKREPADLRLVSCHLGGGCSATAIRGGAPVATTLGFTALDGLMMGTRSGSVDPGILIHLQRRHGLTADDLDHALNDASGLLGVSGLSPDLAKIEMAAAQGHERARLAFDLFVDRVRSAIGALTVTLGGIDALVFTDRIGEKSAAFRTAACSGLDCLGVQLDPSRNSACQPDTDIATNESAVRVLVIHTQEELMIAREARRLLPQPAQNLSSC